MGTLLLPLNFSCESSTILQGKLYFQKTTVSYITKAKQEKYGCPYQRGTGTHTCPGGAVSQQPPRDRCAPRSWRSRKDHPQSLQRECSSADTVISEARSFQNVRH